MNSELKILLIFAAVFIVAYLINSYSCENFSDTPKEDMMDNNYDDSEIDDDITESTDSTISSGSDVPAVPAVSAVSAVSVVPDVPTVPKESFSDVIAEGGNNTNSKFNTKNSAKDMNYKSSNYRDSSRGQSTPELGKYFDNNNEVVKNGYLSNDEYSGKDETDDMFASYNPGPKKMMNDEDIFKSEEYLAKETNQNWFEVPPEPISIKNRHLINISRPIGVNTIGNSLRNPSYDLRGSPPNPKFVVSPWMQSTIEPDLNIKGLC